MNINKTVTKKRLQIAFLQILFICSLLLVFACTKEKESKRDYPRVVTGLVTNINADGVTFNGSFSQAGSSEIIDHGFVFTTASSPDIRYNEKISLGASNGKGSFTATANFGLEKGKTYYVSAYAQNKEKIFYAESVEFVSMGFGASPEIASIEPSEGFRYDTVVIKGRNFSQVPNNNTVKFGDAQAAIIKASDTELTVRVPTSNGMEFVDVFVTIAGQTAQKINGFKYLIPEIIELSSAQGVIGDTITITGKYFQRDMVVKFNQVTASRYQSDYNTWVSVIVPACQSTQANVTVTCDGFTSVAEQIFTYAKAEVTGLSANMGVVGDTIVIHGKNFGYSKNYLSVFWGEQAITVVEMNNSSIKIVVPASEGQEASLPVTVKVDEQLATGNQVFTYLAPVIESFEPQSACGGDTVVIRGQYFLTTNQLSVSFGSYSVEKFGMVSDTEIQAVVPFSNGVEEVSISVKNNGITVNLESKFRYLKPEISNIAPDKGIKNDQVTVTGSNFGSYSSNISIYFDAEKVAISEHTPNKLIISVPRFQGNKLSDIRIVRDGLTGWSAQKFQYMEPVISGFSPSSGRVGDIITITGLYFSDNQNDVRVYCGEYQLTIESCTDNQIVVSIPNTAASANQSIRVIVDGNEGVSATSFEIISPWTKKAATPNERYYPITATYNNEGYVALGRRTHSSPNEFTDCWKYNPAEDSWQLVTPSWDIYRLSATFFQINDLWFFGGGIYNDDFYQVSLGSMIRKTLPNLPRQGMNETFSFVIDNKAYICGGSDFSNMIWQYDSQTEEWTEKASLPAAGRSLGIAFSHNGKGYAGLGVSGWGLSGWEMNSYSFNDFYEYDPQTNVWSRKADFPGIAVRGAITFTINNRIFVGLGRSLEPSQQSGYIWEYIPATDTWSHVAIIPSGGGDGAYVFVINNKAYIGSSGSFGIYNLGIENRDFYEFDPSKL